MDSLGLSLMLLVFFLPLVAYFVASSEIDVETVEAIRASNANAGPKSVRVSSYHPVLRQNVAISRLMALERL